MYKTWRGLLLATTLVFIPPVAAHTDRALDVEQILRDIRQDHPVPTLDYLREVEPINIECAYYRGDYQGIEVSVETHPQSNKVASILLQIPGSNQTRRIVDAVARVIGPPHVSDPEQSHYGWDWPNYRTASVHYAAGGEIQSGLTVVSFFYR